MKGCGLVVGREMGSKEKQGKAVRFEVLLIYKWTQRVFSSYKGNIIIFMYSETHVV